MQGYSYSWKTVIPCKYSTDGHDLETVSEHSDLGVIMDPRLRFDRHVNAIVCKARSMLGFIKRWSKEFKDPYVTKLLYTPEQQIFFYNALHKPYKLTFKRLV